jgi:hypothetical protein
MRGAEEEAEDRIIVLDPPAEGTATGPAQGSSRTAPIA